MIVLGIETSCDETAAAVLEDGTRILSSVVASQVDVHHRYGGVVPELASRKHMEAIVPVVEEALLTAGICKMDLDAIAVTRGPGLVGSLLVGFSFAKALAWSLGRPWVGVDHLAGHINSIFLSPEPPPFPLVVLMVSGGHTALYHVTDYTRYELMGRTRDDAAGEAYDKVAKMLGLGYPGGAIIDAMAREGTPGNIRFTRPYLDKTAFDFSFSGLKSAVNRHIQTHPENVREKIRDIAAEFQAAVVDVLSHKLIHAAKTRGCHHVAIVGGVAANSSLRERVVQEAQKAGLCAHLPSREFCGDNAAMIAAVGFRQLDAGARSSLDEDVYSRAELAAAMAINNNISASGPVSA